MYIVLFVNSSEFTTGTIKKFREIHIIYQFQIVAPIMR